MERKTQINPLCLFREHTMAIDPAMGQCAKCQIHIHRTYISGRNRE